MERSTPVIARPGRRITIAGEELLDHAWLTNIPSLSPSARDEDNVLMWIPESPRVVRLAIRWMNGEELDLEHPGIERDPADMPLIEEGASIKYDDDEYNIHWEECVPGTEHDLVEGVINTPYSAADLMQSWDKRVLAVFKVWAFANKHEGLADLKIAAVNAFHLLTRDHRSEPGSCVPEWSDVNWLWKNTKSSPSRLRKLVIHYIAQHPYMQFFNHQGLALPASVFSSVVRRRMSFFWGHNVADDDASPSFWARLCLCPYHDHKEEGSDCSEGRVWGREGLRRGNTRLSTMPIHACSLVMHTSTCTVASQHFHAF